MLLTDSFGNLKMAPYIHSEAIRHRKQMRFSSCCLPLRYCPENYRLMAVVRINQSVRTIYKIWIYAIIPTDQKMSLSITKKRNIGALTVFGAFLHDSQLFVMKYF